MNELKICTAVNTNEGGTRTRNYPETEAFLSSNHGFPLHTKFYSQWRTLHALVRVF
jgi:hypothetical protein